MPGGRAVCAEGARCYTTTCARGGGGLATCVPEVLEVVLHMLKMLEGTRHVLWVLNIVEDMGRTHRKWSMLCHVRWRPRDMWWR